MLSEFGQRSFTAAKKKHFLPFIDNNKQLFAMKMINHHDKQLTPSESWDRDRFFEPGFGVSSLLNHWARILQRCGHKIRVNTWTVSYPLDNREQMV